MMLGKTFHRMKEEETNDNNDDEPIHNKNSGVDKRIELLLNQVASMDPNFKSNFISLVDQYADIVKKRNVVATGIYAVPRATVSVVLEEEKKAHHARHWMDLFFDLIYVASAFQLGILFEDLTKQFAVGKTEDGLLGLFLWVSISSTIFHTWEQKLELNQRFIGVDITHRIWELIESSAVACLAVNIPQSIVEVKANNFEILKLFALFKMIQQVVILSRWIEIAALSRTSFSLKNTPFGNSAFSAIAGDIILSPLSDTSAKTLHRQSRSTAFFFSAMQLSGLALILSSFLVSLSPVVQVSNAFTIAALWVCSVIVEKLIFLFRLLIPFRFGCWSVNDLSPIDVEYTVHRFGEWTMLILGEGVLSMILVPADKDPIVHFAAFIPGFVVLACLQVLYYSSQPAFAEGHALYRDVVRGFIWQSLQPSLSGVIIIIGVSLKLVLKATDQTNLTIGAWILCGSLTTFQIIVLLSQITHNGISEEFIVFTKNSPFAGTFKVGLWIAKLFAALLYLPLPLIPNLPAYGLFLLCSVLTISQVVMLIMTGFVDDYFSPKVQQHQQPKNIQKQPSSSLMNVEEFKPHMLASNSSRKLLLLRAPSKSGFMETNMADLSQNIIPENQEPTTTTTTTSTTFTSAIEENPILLSADDLRQLFNQRGMVEKLQEILQSKEVQDAKSKITTAITVTPNLFKKFGG